MSVNEEQNLYFFYIFRPNAFETLRQLKLKLNVSYLLYFIRLSHSPKSPHSKLTPPTVRATKSVPDLEEALRIVRGDYSATSDQHKVERYHTSCQHIANPSGYIDSEIGSRRNQLRTSQSSIEISKST